MIYSPFPSPLSISQQAIYTEANAINWNWSILVKGIKMIPHFSGSHITSTCTMNISDQLDSGKVDYSVAN